MGCLKWIDNSYFNFPFPSAKDAKTSEVELSGKSAYSFFLARNLFAYLIAVASIYSQVYLYMSLDLFEEACDYFEHQFKTESKENSTWRANTNTVASQILGGPVMYKRIAGIQAQCNINEAQKESTNHLFGPENNHPLQCTTHEVEIRLGAFVLGAAYMIILFSPKISTGYQLLLRGGWGPVLAGITHAVMGLLAIVFGYVWALATSEDCYSFVLHIVALRFIHVFDEQVYSFCSYLAPVWLEDIFCAANDVVGESDEDSIKAVPSQIALEQP